MNKQRIQVYADAEMKRRIELAAMNRNVSVTVYCMEAIRNQLADEDLLEREQIDIFVHSDREDNDLLADLDELHAKILAGRGGKPIDVDIIELVRQETDDELTGLH